MIQDTTGEIALPAPTDGTELVCGYTLKDWGEKIAADLKLRRTITRPAHELIRRYTGEARTLTNFEFEFISVLGPSLAYALPKCRVTDGGTEDEQTEDSTTAINCLIRQNGLSEQLQLMAIDMAFSFAAGIVVLEPTPGLLPDVDLVPLRPVIRRVSPNMYFRDCESVAYARVRHEGHLWIESIKNLESAVNADGTPRYDNTQLTGIQPGTLDSQIRSDLMLDGVSVAVDDKERVVCATVYVAEEDTILTFAMNDTEPRLLRKVKAQCAGESPYTLFTVYAAPDRVYPVAPLQTTATWLEVHEKMTRNVVDHAAKAKTVTIVDSQQAGVSDILDNAKHQALVGVPGFNGKVTQVEYPGVSKDMMAMTAYAGEQADRRVGLSEQARGVTSNSTATESAIAGQFTDIKSKYQTQMFTAGVATLLRKVVRLMNESEDVIFPISKDGRRATFFGGEDEDQRDQQRLWRRDATVEIEPFSMSYTNSAMLRQQLIEFVTMAMDVADRALANPSIQAAEIIGDVAQHFNIAKAAERYIVPPGMMGMGGIGDVGGMGMSPGMTAGPQGATPPPAANPGEQMNPGRMVPANL